MIVYQKNKESFINDVTNNIIADEILTVYQEKLGKNPSPSEYQSWQNSSQYMQNVLSDSGIPGNCGISIEYNVPATAKRIDFVISGHDQDSNKLAIIVELKQWSSAEKTSKDAIVSTYIGKGERETAHPSYQAWSYAALLKDFNTYVYENNIGVYPCAYLHNCDDKNGSIMDDFYKSHLEKAPVFLKHDIHKLRDFIKKYVKTGDEGETIYEIEHGEIRPSKALADSLLSMLKGNQEFVLIDEQKLVYETVLAAARKETEKKTVIIVEGGPGTGKSVVAINLLVQLNGDRKTCHYVTRNAAPREVYAAKLTSTFKKTHISNIFKGSGSYTDTESNSIDVLVIDEAHRLNDKSGMFRNQGENQIKELIHTAKTSVFFIDENQKIHIHDIGDIEEIEFWANKYDAEVIKLELESQFRCGGSDGFIAWIDNTLDIRRTANYDLSDIQYDFRVYDDPEEMRKAIKEENKANNKSRLLAGYCWDWESKSNPLAYDIHFDRYNFKMKWNLNDDGMLWIMKENSVDEVGCIHTCQGLELDYAGVIIGPDMRYENGKIVTDVLERSKNDRTVFGMKKMIKEDEATALELADNIIKNTYRTLMTRGMKGCFVYCVDPLLRDYLKASINRESTS
jgi:DUF2075 family protein